MAYDVFGAQTKKAGDDAALVLRDNNGVDWSVETDGDNDQLVVKRAGSVIFTVETAGGLTLASGQDIAFTGATGTNEITVADNVADALSVKITGGNDFLVLDSTNSNEKITLGATGQKLAFLGGTPQAVPTAYTQTYSTADRTHANLTSATLTDNTAGTANTTLQALADGTTYATDVAAIRNNFADLAASNNAIIADLTDLKQLVNAIIDDLQGYGLAA